MKQRGMNNELGKILVLVAHPNLKESRANKELVDTIKDDTRVVVFNLYEQKDEFFDVDFWSKQMSEAFALIFQFPLHWMSAPYMLKKWQDEVFTQLSKSPVVLGKPLLVVTSTASGYDAYRSGGRNYFTIDEILRPYQASALYAGMVWKSPIVVYGAEDEDAGKRISICADKYKSAIDEIFIKHRRTVGSEW